MSYQRGPLVFLGEGPWTLEDLVHYELAGDPRSPEEARLLMRAAAWCWRRCARPYVTRMRGCGRCHDRLSKRPQLPMAALCHLQRAKGFRDRASALAGHTQRELELGSVIVGRATPKLKELPKGFRVGELLPGRSREGQASEAMGVVQGCGQHAPSPPPYSTTIPPYSGCVGEGRPGAA